MDGGFKPGNATCLGYNTYYNDDAIRGNAFSASSPSTQTTDAGTHISGTGTLDLNGLTFNEVITLDSKGIGGKGGLINSNTGTPAVLDNGVAFVKINSGGSGYNGTTPTVMLSGGGGFGAEVDAATTVSATPLALGLTTASIDSVSGGNGFAVGDKLALNGPYSGTYALVQVTSVGGSGDITGVEVVDSGSGFSDSTTIDSAIVVSMRERRSDRIRDGT